MLRFFVAVSLLVLAGCSSEPAASSPPAQGFSKIEPASFTFEPNKGNDYGHVIGDIFPSADKGAWTGKHPAVKIKPASNANLGFIMDFYLADINMVQTGPVDLKFFVGDHLLDTVHYPNPGVFRFEKAVPADWVTPGKEITVAAEIDKLWKDPKGGPDLGFILHRIGLIDK